jgi:hypothetical protein
MADDNNRITVDRDATGEKEAREQFANPDERREQGRRTHELSLLQARMGPIGKLIGSSDVALTIAFVVLVLCFACLLSAGFASIWRPGAYAAISGDIYKIVLAVIGYVIGKAHGSKTE